MTTFGVFGLAVLLVMTACGSSSPGQSTVSDASDSSSVSDSPGVSESASPSLMDATAPASGDASALANFDFGDAGISDQKAAQFMTECVQLSPDKFTVVSMRVQANDASYGVACTSPTVCYNLLPSVVGNQPLQQSVTIYAADPATNPNTGQKIYTETDLMSMPHVEPGMPNVDNFTRLATISNCLAKLNLHMR